MSLPVKVAKDRTMDLILWRHAEALDITENQPSDLARQLTPRGMKQAQRMGKWLEQHLPSETRILCSPAQRCVETVQALGRKYKVHEELAPDQDDIALLQLAQWPDAKQPLLIVGHQPTLGYTVARLLGWSGHELSVRKGAVWWLRSRVRQGERQTVVHCVQTPDMVW
jgi:phosphohistidine phosphatase